MADNLQSQAKQGVGFAVVVDGEEFVGKISDPGTQNTPRPAISTVHTGLTSVKTSIPDELSDEFEQVLSLQFDPRLEDLRVATTGTGAKTDRNIYLIYPKVPDLVGANVTEHGYVHLSQGRLTSEGISVPVDNIMDMQLKVSSGNAEPTSDRQKDAIAVVGCTFTQTAAAASASDGDLLGTLSQNSFEGPVVYVLGGTDAAKVTLKSSKIYALGAQAADLSITITCKNWVDYRGDTSTYDQSLPVTIDLTP